LAALLFEEKMKPGRRRQIEKTKTPKDIAEQFREWQKLRVEVSKAELAAAKRKAAGAKIEGNGGARKPTGRSRTH